MRLWISATSSLALVVMIAKVRTHSPRSRILPVLPNAAQSERIAILHSDGIWLLRLAFDRLPLEKAVNRHDAAAPPIGISEGRQRAHCLALCIDRLATALRILTKMRDQAPAQRIERYLARLMVAPNDQQLLAGRAIPMRRLIVHAAVPRVQAVNDGEGNRSATLDDSAAHDRYVATRCFKSSCRAALRG